ncbi:MAG: metalloregulator ArsR/SmtB family transcription factor [Actinomycetota bacterium]
MATIDREAKRELFDAFALIGKAVSSGRRVELLDVLANGERSVDVLSEQLALSVANTSQHLQILKQAGLVATRRSGTSVRYRLASPEVFAFLTSLRGLAASRLGDVDRLSRAYLGEHDGDPAITRDGLASRLGTKGLFILDVRPREEFESGHLPGAVSAPLDELTEHLRHLPKDAQIVVYCRGPFCAYSYAAVELLRKRGFRASRLESGLPEWEAGGYPTEHGTE